MSRLQLLVTAAGPDRIGFVDELTRVLVNHGANIDESRMARLAGDFAALLLVSISPGNLQPLSAALDQLKRSGVEVSLREVRQSDSPAFSDYRPFTIAVRGADHEGIVQSVAHALTELGVNIAELESEVVQAPESGAPLFNMRARLQVPPALPDTELESRLRRVAELNGVDLTLAGN